jgi:hypothetical protein
VIHHEGGDLEVRYMTAADEAAVLAFAQALPEHDLLFLPRDITQPKVLAAWIQEMDRGALTSLLAVREGTVLGLRDHRIATRFRGRHTSARSGSSSPRRRAGVV